MTEEMNFQVFLKLTEIQRSGRSGKGFESLCDGTTRRRSLADLRLLEGM